MIVAMSSSADTGLSLMPADLRPSQRWALALGVAVAHGALAWAIWHWNVPPQHPIEPPVITATLVPANAVPQAWPAHSTPPAEAPVLKPQTTTGSTARLPMPVLTPAPIAAAPAPVLSSTRPTSVQEVAPPNLNKPNASPTTVNAVPAVPAVPSTTAPVSPTQPVDVPGPSAVPKELPSSAVRYLSLPPKIYPRMSQDQGETGVVQLKVLVDEEGRPKEVVIAKSSGFPRLDRQAISNMKAARFQPHIEAGVARAFWVPAEIVFNLE